MVAEHVVDAIEKPELSLASLPLGVPGACRERTKNPWLACLYIIAYALTAETQDEVVSILRVIHAARHWPTGEWPEQDPTSENPALGTGVQEG